MAKPIQSDQNSSNFRTMTKRFSFEIKITGILLVILTLVALTGVFAYQRFAGVVNKISDSVRPDMRLLTAKALINEINDAEISVKSYRITEDTIYLDAFYYAVKNIQNELNILNTLSVDRFEIDNHTELDSLGYLIDSKIHVLNDLLFLQDGFRTGKALDKVSEAIEKSAVEKEPVEEGLEDKERFSWLFRRNKRDSIKTDTLLSIGAINKEVSVIKSEEAVFQKEFRKKELELIIKDQVLSEQIKIFFNELENTELEKISKETEYAEEAIAETNTQIAIFCAVTGLLLLFMSFIIINYVRNNNRYRIALKKAKNQAEDLAKIKQKFLDNMSHEIRTPMNAIAGFSEQIGQGPLNDVQREQLNMVQKSTDHLLYIINEVLDLSKLHADKIKLEQIAFNPSELIVEIAKSMSNEAKIKNLDLTYNFVNTIPEVLIGDTFRLRQILFNLIGNALKFTENGGVNLSTQTIMTNQTDCVLRIEVEDTGIGIDNSNLTKVFDEFEQAEANTTRKYGGSGLGLSIVKQLVELHNGKITVKSKLGHGTTITLDIPYKIGERQELEENQEIVRYNPDQLKGLKVLIVDDERYNRLLIISILKKFNIKYTEAGNGEEAINELEKNQYDLILMDIRMPVIDGYQATKIIRKKSNPEKSRIPIIALTAAVSSENRENYKKAGMNDILAKPFKEHELLSVIDKCLNLSFVVKEKTKEKMDEVGTIINLTALRELSGNDADFYYDMLTTFNEGTITGMEQIQTSLKAENWDMMAEYAHKISSPCNHIGAKKLYTILKEIETNGRSKEKLAMMPNLVNEMQEVGELVVSAINQEINKIQNTKP